MQSGNTRWSRFTAAAIIVLTAIPALSHRFQFDRERTRQASQECELLARIAEDAVKTGDDLTLSGFIFAMKNRGPSINARFLDTKLIVRNSTDTAELGMTYSGPCLKETCRANPGAPPVVCSSRNSSDGLPARMFALPVRNPITGAHSGMIIVNYPEAWFTEGFSAAALPSLAAGVLFFSLGVLLLRRKAVKDG